MNIHSKIKVLLLLGGTITAFQSASAAPPSEKKPADSGQNTAPTAEEPSQRSTNPSPAPAGAAALTPKSLTKGTVLRIKIALTTTTVWNGDKYSTETESELNEESFTWKTPTSYADPDADEFSCVYKKIDNFTGQITFNQTKNSDGTLAEEHGKGKLILLFTSYDAATGTLFGTVVTSESYIGNGSSDEQSGNYADSASGSGIFSLKIK
ncbi:MAG: hypothetical protein ABIT37_25680 [Luteolibacter sp.]